MNAILIECNFPCVKMRYSIEPRERRCGFLSFAKNICRNLSNKYGQKLVHNAKKSATDAFKIASKRAIQKTAEATGDLVRNKILQIKLQVFQKNQQVNHIKMGLAMKYRRKDIYLHRKDKKLLMN